MKIIILVEEGSVSAAYAAHAESPTTAPEIVIVDRGDCFDDEEPDVEAIPLQPIEDADETVRKAIE